MRAVYAIILSVILLSCAGICAAQNSELQKAIALYNQGANEEAIKILEKLGKIEKSPDQVTVLNYLGLAYVETSELKKGRKILEKAASLAPQNAVVKANLAYAYLRSNKLNDAQAEAAKAIAIEPKLYTAYYVRGTAYLWERKFDEAVADADQVMAVNPNFTAAYILKSNAFVAKFGNRVGTGSTPKKELDFLGKAIEALEACVKNCRNNSKLQMQKEELESLRVFYNYFDRDPNAAATILSPTDTTNQITVTYKPRASYTDQARQAGISGKIVLAVLFAANSTVTQVIVLKPLGYGLDQEAIKAAKGIKFTPFIKDGKPVSIVRTVEYSFSIY